MKTKSIIYILLVFAAVALIYFTVIPVSSPASPAAYAGLIQQERAEKDNFMKSSAESPFVQQHLEFTKLNYFPPDASYRVEAKLETIESKQLFHLITSDNAETDLLEFAWAKFELNGKQIKLLLLEVTEPGPSHGTLFLAFADETSGQETYGAGRYIDLKKIPAMTSVVIDFNKAYNPYCAYSDKFSCPFPPPENILKVSIAAGEKTYH